MDDKTGAYSDAELAQKALDFIRTCSPKDYRQMKRDGELDDWCQIKVRATKSLAESFISNGMFERLAWQTAIRQAILEMESD